MTRKLGSKSGDATLPQATPRPGVVLIEALLRTGGYATARYPVPATAFIPSNSVCTGPTPPLVGSPRGGTGPSTVILKADNRGARVHTPRVPAIKQRPGALAAAGALRRPYVGTGSNINTRPGPPQASRPVRSHHNRNVAPPGPPPPALNPANQMPRAVPLYRHGPSLATSKGPHHAVREVDAMADSGQNLRFTGTSSPPAESPSVHIQSLSASRTLMDGRS